MKKIYCNPTAKFFNIQCMTVIATSLGDGTLGDTVPGGGDGNAFAPGIGGDNSDFEKTENPNDNVKWYNTHL